MEVTITLTGRTAAHLRDKLHAIVGIALAHQIKCDEAIYAAGPHDAQVVREYNDQANVMNDLADASIAALGTLKGK